MDTLKDKVIGSWYGMAVGDAMGLTVRGLKPETVRQLFRSVDGFKDVRPFLGKGIKRFKMQGLYGSQTQSALVVGDCLLKNKSGGVKEITELLVQLSVGGPESYFGVYRHPEGAFRQAVGSLMERSSLGGGQHNRPDAAFAAMGIPVGLLNRDRAETAIRLSVETGLLMSRNLCEVTGMA
ncbi:MAG: ADP-ribosylglycohydrolase family protein, partial [Nitrospinae bacterium]|nr:ADP-ribosylglycohydrolase family protein [Nitrospinota bacterium]